MARCASTREQELARLDAQCRGLLASLESAGILSPSQREIVIDRLLALDAEELDLEQVKWVVLMVLSSQPGQEVVVRVRWRIWCLMAPRMHRTEPPRACRQPASAARPRFFVYGPFPDSDARHPHG